ncbi:hypothetical protein HDV63DRAFT_393258 [Trichoderma sp. SZMC 28014]
MEEKSSGKRKLADSFLQKANEEYTVGWICAICTEYTAAQAVLDEEHERPDYIASSDHNDYTVGRIGKHNVVIAVLPDGEYGTDSAALVAKAMLDSFENIKVGLMVGIGGGAPSERHDIRLGDIVVSAPRDGQSGVLQYDFGKMVQGEPFQPTRLLNQSPRILRAAVNGLKSQYQLKGYGQLREIIGDILERNPNLRKDFERPDPTSDRLYRSEIVHPAEGTRASDCSVSCGDDPSKLIVRSRRIADESSPVVHYGLVASANTLMKDAVLRDKFALEKNIMCFEMEAAGLMNHFPCLVVRGICDYSDSHKNKQWQGCAAIAAAAYAKNLLHRIPLDNISTLRRIVRKAQIPSEEQRQALLKSLKFDQHKDRHDHIKAAHAETCKWLQKSAEYLDWLDPGKIHDHHGFLWIKGKPGAGKSTIMKFALATARKSMGDGIIISFFFNARGGSLEKSTIGMYRSLLLQLLQQLPALQDELDLSDFKPLKSLFHQAVENIQKSRCDEDEIRDMIKFFEYLGHLAVSQDICFLVYIVKYVRSELNIGQDNIASQIHADIPRRSRGIFMWEYDKGRIYNLQRKYQEIPGDLHELFRDILTRSSDEKSRETLRCLQWILFAERPLAPEELYSARFVLDSSLGYADIIASNDSMHKTVQFIHESVKDFLLKENGLREIWTGSGGDIHGQSHEELKQCCLRWIAMGSAICSTISFYSTRMILNQGANKTLPFLDYAIRNVLFHANAAQKYGINQAEFLKEFDADIWNMVRGIFQDGVNSSGPRLLYTLAAENMSHLIGIYPSKLAFSEVGEEYFGTPIFAALAKGNNEVVLELLKAQAENIPSFHDLYEEYRRKNFTVRDFRLHSTFPRHGNILSHFTHPDEGNKILQVAILLSMHHLNLDWEDECSQSPLLFAYSKGNKALLDKRDIDMIQLLISAGADIEACGWNGTMSPLGLALRNGSKDLVDMLLENGADIDAMDHRGLTLLIQAIEDGCEDTAIQLLEKGADIDAMDKNGQTPLMWAIRKRNLGLRILPNRELTLLEFARQFEDSQIIELLSRGGAP